MAVGPPGPTPRLYSMVDLLEAAQLAESARMHLSPLHMKLCFAAQRRQLAPIPTEYHPQYLWANYVALVIKHAELFGLADNPRYEEWLHAVNQIRLQLATHKVAAPDTQVLELLVAAHAQTTRTPAASATV